MSAGNLDLGVGTSGELSISIPQTNPAKDDFICLTDEIIVYRDDKEIWRGRAITRQYDFYLTGALTCEGVLSYLYDTYYPPFEFQSSPTEFLEVVLENHNSQVEDRKKIYLGNVTVEDNNDYINRSSIYYNRTLTVLTEKLINDSLGGYFRIRIENGKKYLDYLESYGTTATQAVKFGSNMLDIAQNVEYSDLATVILPLGAKLEDADGNETDEYLTIESVNGSIYYADEAAVKEYGWIVVSYEWEDVTEASNLLTKAKNYLAQVTSAVSSFEIKAVDLALLSDEYEAFSLGDYILIQSEPHGVNQYVELTEMSIDLLAPENSTYTFGAESSSLVDSQRTSDRVVQAAIESLSARYTNLVATVITTEYLNANYITANEINATYIKTNELSAEIANFGYVTAAEIDAIVANFGYVTATEVDAIIGNFGYLTADSATITTINSDLANITAILSGSIGTGTLQAIHITSENTVIDEAVIESAAIVSLAADKITSGTIYTSFVTIKTGDDGTGLYIADDLIAMYDDNGTMRLQAGSTDDLTGAKNGYNFVIWDEEGTVLFNATGITASGIPAETIVNEHVADNAAIDGSKLNITSVISYIESDGSLTVDYANVIIDNTTMSAWYVSVNDSVDGLTNTMSTLQSEFTVVQGQITSKVWESDITTAIDALSVGGRNYLLNTKALTVETAKTYYSSTYWSLTEDDDGYGVITSNTSYSAVARSLRFYTDINPFEDGDTSEHKWSGESVIFSFDFKCPYATAIPATSSSVYDAYVSISIYGSNDLSTWVRVRYTDMRLGDTTYRISDDCSDTDWFRLKMKRNMPALASLFSATTSTYKYYRYAAEFRLSGTNTQTDAVSIRKPKLELGTVATDWTPAPEDVDENLTIITDKYSSVTQTIDGITDEIGEITETVDSNYKTLESKITTVEETANGVVTTVKDLTTTVNNWDVGGRNYLLNTKDLTYQTSQTVYSPTYWTRTVDNDGYGVLTVTGNGGWLNVDLYTSIDATDNPWEGKEIVFSADVKAGELKTSPAKYVLSVEIFGSDDGTSWVRGYYTYTLLSSSSFYTFNKDDWADGEWVRLTAKFTMPALSSMTTSTGADYTYHVYGMAIYSTATNTDTELSFRKPKLELGTVATDWTPAPEDVDYATSIISDKYATLSVTVDGIIGTVGDLESTVTDYYSEIDNRIIAVAATADGVVTTVENLHAIVNNWDVGGRNYLLNTKALTEETAKTYYSSTYWSLTEDDDGYGVITSNTSYSAVARSLRFYTDINPFEDGDTSEHKWSGESVIFSFDFKCSYASAIPATSSSVYDAYVSISIYGSNDLTTWVRYCYTDMRLGDTTYRISDDCSDTDWFRLKMKRNMPALASLSSATTSTYKYYRYAAEFRLSGTNTQTDAVSIRKPKLELGTVATDWTPAPEDVDYATSIISDKYAALSVTVDGIIGTVGDLESTVTDYYSEIDNRITTVAETADGVVTTVESLYAIVYNWDVGGRNYLLNTKELSYEYGKTQYNTTYWELTEDENGYGVLAPTEARVGVAASGIYLFSAIEPFPDSDTSSHVWAGKETRLSFDMKCPYADKVYADTSGYTIYVRYAIYGSNNKTSWSLVRYLDAYLGNPDTQGNFEYSNTDWFRWVYKQTWPESMDSGWTGINSGSYTYYRYVINLILPVSNTQTDTVYFRKPKLELGTVATDWTPAPEDVDYATSIISDKYATLETTVNGIYGEVGDLQTVVSDNYTYFYNRVTAVEETADGLSATVSNFETTLNNNILADSTFDGYTTFGSSYSWYRTSSTYIKVSEYDDDVCVCFTRGGSSYYLRQAISLDAGTYVVRAKIACGDGCAPAVRARLGSTYAYLHDTGELSSEWKTYSTTITITSAATYYYLYVYAAYGSTSDAETECYVTNLAVYDDYSIDYTQSQIQVLSDSISMSVTGSLGDTASIVISANGSEVSKTTLDLSGVRSAFADDTTAVTISAGTVTFKSGTLVVDADNFKLASDGSAALYGSVYFNNSLYMHFDKADVSAGYYNIIKTEVLDSSYSGIYFGMIDDSSWFGETFLYLGTDGGFRLRSGGSDIFIANNTGGTNAAFIFSRDLGQQPKLMDYGYGVFGYNTNNKFYLTWDKSTPALGITVDSTAFYLTYTTSDERLKQNIADIDDALIDSVGNAPLLSFNMDCEAYDDSVTYVGTTAQLLIEQMAANGLTTDDARKLLAQQTVYTDSSDKYWMIDYEQFLLLRIAYDEKRIAALESQLAAYV